jgi:hypothetical protein
VSNTDQTAIDLLLHCHEAGDEIRGRAEWSKLYRELIVAAAATSVTLPSDFHRLIQGGPITRNSADYIPILPVRSADAWRFLEGQASAQPYYFIGNGQIKFSPALNSSGAMVRYISKNWIHAANVSTSTQTTFNLDSDVADLPETLLIIGTAWRFKRAKGRPYQDLLDEFETVFAREIRFDRGIVT